MFLTNILKLIFEYLSDIPNNIWELITIFIGFAFIMFTNHKHRKHEIRLQKIKIRDEFKLAVYHNITKSINQVHDENISSYTLTLKTYCHALNLPGMTIAPPTQRLPVFMERHSCFAESVGNLVSVIEQNEVINKDLKVFRKAFLAQMYEVDNIFYTQLFGPLKFFLPIDIPDLTGKKIETTPFHRPDEETINLLEQLLDEYWKACLLIHDYTYDLLIETQNSLVGELFETIIDVRQPLDPSYKAINFQDKTPEEWVHYFEKETAWGKSNYFL